MFNSVFWIAGLIAFASVLGYLLYSLKVRQSDGLPDPEWLSTFSPARYRPMLRLLSADDRAYLISQGLEGRSIERFNAERRQVFGVYLKNLVRDFNRLHYTATLMLLHSETDRPELTSNLFRLRMDFNRAVLMVRFSLVLHSFGIGTVDVGRLVSALETVHSDFRQVSMSPA